MIATDLEYEVDSFSNDFAGKPFGDFELWFSSIIHDINPTLIVGIARGAIRLLQVQGIPRAFEDIEIVTDCALPFLPATDLKRRRVLLFDDSVIFGSTMSKLREYLIDRGAVVFSASYVVDRYNFYGEKPGEFDPLRRSQYADMPLRAKHALWPSAIRMHHDILVRSMHRLPNTYNIDFPTILLQIPELGSSDVPLIINTLLSKKVFKHIHDVSTPEGALNGIYRHVALIDGPALNIFPEDGVFCRQYSKVRMAFIPRLGVIRVTPLPQLAITHPMLFQQVQISNEALHGMWRTLRPPENTQDPFYHQALSRLLSAFAALILGDATIRELSAAIPGKQPQIKANLLIDDLALVLSRHNAMKLQEIFQRLQIMPPSPGILNSLAKPGTNFKEPIDTSLFTAVAHAWSVNETVRPRKQDTLYEQLGKLFLTLREVTDSQEARKRNPNASRLDVGFAYDGIRELFHKECGIDLSFDDVSVGIDMCIDNGQAVPKLIRQGLFWLRAFYSGEAVTSNDLMQFADAIHRAYADFLKQKKIKALAPFDMHKICSTLKDLMLWLPISSRYYVYGKFAMVGKSEEELISWLARDGNGPLRIIADEKRKTLALNDSYKPLGKPTWSPRKARDFFDGFRYMATSFSTVAAPAKLLISTCRTHRHTFNAVCFEGHSWCGTAGRGYDFGTFLSSVRREAPAELYIAEERALCLYWCIRYLSEAGNKFTVFHRKFKSNFDKLKAAFLKQGAAAETFWEYFVERSGLVKEDREATIEELFKLLMPLIRQMRHLTAFTVRLVTDLSVIPNDILARAFLVEKRSIGDNEFSWSIKPHIYESALAYNRGIEYQEVPGISIFKTRLPTFIKLTTQEVYDKESTWLSLLDGLYSCFEEIKSALQIYCPEYNVNEGDFPYSPDYSRRVLRDGSVERVCERMFVLTMDIIGSTDSPKTNDFKNMINDLLQEFRSKGIYFEVSGNDAFLVCSEDPTVLWDIARVVMIRGEVLIGSGGPLAGTRKALSLGRLRIVEKDSESLIIADAWTPHHLPRAFSMLTGVDEYCDTRGLSKNSTLLIEESAAKELSHYLRLDLSSNETFGVEGKHFKGKCYALDLNSIGKS
jgi:hypothetical protein